MYRVQVRVPGEGAARTVKGLCYRIRKSAQSTVDWLNASKAVSAGERAIFSVKRTKR